MLIALILFGLIGIAVFVAVVFLGVFKVDSDQNKAEKNSGEALDKLFNGATDVTFSGHLRSMKYETVILGAKERGYKVAHQAGDPKATFTLIFEKA
ncbi:hypothetical protein [Microbacterium sp. LWH12-1.2]|uniref:hypothetical protein n=1 Tax=Microbacterium sp. LWH12-1.2 TaxID=3135259 RepID=UPI0034314133